MSDSLRGAPAPRVEVLASLAQHRILTSAQVRAIHLPERGLRWAQRLLARLEREGLAARAPALRAQRVWYATERGVQALRGTGALEGEVRHLDPTAAAGPLQAHTLAVNDAAICFLAAARERGDEFGPLAWRHEVAHPLTRGRGRRRRAVIADAVLTYLREEDSEVVVEQRFLEADRATLPVDRLAAELARYAELQRATDGEGEPLWRRLYPNFPSVICVLSGADRAALARRRERAVALLRVDPGLALVPAPRIRFCLAQDLAERGPLAPIFTDVREPGRPTDWVSAPREGAGG